jgi:hypothetical protein
MAISKAELDAIAKLVEEACGDWASLGFDKDEDGYLWAMGYAFGRETKQLREDRRFTRHGESSMMNNPSLRAERYLRMTSVTARELDLLELLETSEYEPLNAVREEYVLRMMTAWKDATLTREEKQVKLATLKEEFLQSIEAEKLRRAEVKRQQEEAAVRRIEAERIAAAERAEAERIRKEKWEAERPIREAEEARRREAARIAHEAMRVHRALEDQKRSLHWEIERGITDRRTALSVASRFDEVCGEGALFAAIRRKLRTSVDLNTPYLVERGFMTEGEASSRRVEITKSLMDPNPTRKITAEWASAAEQRALYENVGEITADDLLNLIKPNLA